MRDLHIRKLCLNICVGESGDRLTRAAKVSYNFDYSFKNYLNSVPMLLVQSVDVELKI